MTDEQFDPETIHAIEAIAAEFTRIIESRNTALEAARAELRSETLWAKQYHDEAEQLRAENARLREALNQAINVLDSTGGLMFNRASEITQSWVYPFTIIGIGQSYANQLRAALATNETPTANAKAVAWTR